MCGSIFVPYGKFKKKSFEVQRQLYKIKYRGSWKGFLFLPSNSHEEEIVRKYFPKEKDQ